MSIADATHPIYDDHKDTWKTTRRMVTGNGVAKELNQRYFEHSDHFAQRQQDADFTPWSRFLMSRLAGMLFQRAGDVERDAGPLSEDDLEETGPNGEAYRVLLLELAEKLMTYDSPVVVFNPASGLRIHSPLALEHWGVDEQGPFAKVRSQKTVANDPFESGEREDLYVIYRAQGFEEWVVREGEDTRVGSGTWAEVDGDEPPFFVYNGQPTPPVFHISMPWEANLGALVAKKHRAIFRLTSRRDFALSAAMNGLIQLGVGEDVDFEDIIKDEAKQGEKFLPYYSDYGEHKGLQIPVDGAQLGTEALQKKKKDLARIAYNEMEKGARSAQSATEAMIKERGAAAAALSVVAETMSDAEQRILSLMVQASNFREFAGPNPSDPGISVSWPTDYSDVVGADQDSLAQKIFGGRWPADEDTAFQVMEDIYNEEGYSPDEDDLRTAVSDTLGNRDRARSAGGFGGGL